MAEPAQSAAASLPRLVRGGESDPLDRANPAGVDTRVNGGRDDQGLAVLLAAAADIHADDLRGGRRPPRLAVLRPRVLVTHYHVRTPRS